MTKKEWEAAIGEPIADPMDGDNLLAQTKSDRSRKRIKRQEEEDEAEHLAAMAKYAQVTKSSEVAVAKTGEKREENGFKVTGGMNLNLDPQRDAREAREELKKQQEKSDDKIGTLTGALEASKGELLQSQITATMKEMSAQFIDALKEMNDRIAAVKSGADPAILATQFEALTKVAEQLGFQKSTPIGDPAIQLEITRLQMESAQKDREFQAKLVQENRQWDLEKMKLEDARAFKRQELAQDAQRNELIAKTPQVIANAVGRGLMARQDKGERVAEEASPEAEAPKKKQGHHVEAGWGESGEVECPGCNQPISIGPTAQTAVCAICGEKVPIKRVGERPSDREVPPGSQFTSQSK